MGIPSSSPWLRRFNGTKPNKHFIELIGIADVQTGILYNFFVNEGFTRKKNGSLVSIISFGGKKLLNSTDRLYTPSF